MNWCRRVVLRGLCVDRGDSRGESKRVHQASLSYKPREGPQAADNHHARETKDPFQTPGLGGSFPLRRPAVAIGLEVQVDGQRALSGPALCLTALWKVSGGLGLPGRGKNKMS